MARKPPRIRAVLRIGAIYPSVAAILVGLAGCGSDGPACGVADALTGPDSELVLVGEVTSHWRQITDTARNSREKAAALISQRDSSFSGFYFDVNEIVLQMTDSSALEPALDVFADYRDGRYLFYGDGSRREVTVLLADYRFWQIADWTAVARANLRPPGVEDIGYAQVDEGFVEVDVAVFDEPCVGPVRDRLLRAGIPEDALTVVWQAPIQLDEG